jgi:zinc protease
VSDERREAVKLACATLALLLSSPALAAGKPELGHKPPLPAGPSWRAPIADDGLTPSGARVVVLPARALPLVHLLVTVPAGSALDPPAHPGLAAATAMMLRDGGAGERTAPLVADAVADLGGDLRVHVDHDEVQLELTVLARHVERALALLGDLVARPRFDAEEWPRAQARRIAEIRRHRDDPPHVADDVFARVLYGEHPYAHPALGSVESVAALGIDDVRRFYAAHYGPRTVTFVLVGDATLAAALSAVERALGDWKSTAAPPPVPPQPQAPAQTRIVIVDRPGAPQSELRVGHLGRDRKTPDFAAIQLLQTVLGGAFTSRLNQNLREKHGYTYGARAHFDLERAPGPFVAEAAVRTDATAPALKETVAELAAMRAPLSRDEVHKGRSLVLSAIVDAFGDGAATAGVLADLTTHKLPLDSWSRLPDALAALDVPQLAQAAARLFEPERLTIVIVGDRKLIDAQVRALPFAQHVEYRDADGKPVK